jgi:hypothetical protein
MPSFDVVSEVDLHAFTNAVDQASRVIETPSISGRRRRFERKGTRGHAARRGRVQLEQMLDILRGALTKCKIDPRAVKPGDVQKSGKVVKQDVTMQHGLDTDLCRKIVKMVKDAKLKVQAAIQGEQVRVTGKKRDDLQDVIALLRASDIDVPLQFENFRD